MDKVLVMDMDAGWMNKERIGVCVDSWINKQTQMDGWLHGTDVWLNLLLDGWMDGGQMDE